MNKIPRIIPVLLYHKGGLYKTVQFQKPVYVGDPINAIKVFNDKEVDELILLDIDASANKTEPNYELISKIASECFMPLCYGGGIKNIEQIKKIIRCGVEKIALNSSAIETPELIREAASKFGSSTIVVSIDYKKNFWGKNVVFYKNGKEKTKYDPLELALKFQNLGAGELLLNSIERDGCMKGYDIEMIRNVSKELDIPVIACGGAGKIDHFVEAINNHASAVAAGSMFVFYGSHRAVLINYPFMSDIKKIFNQ